MNPLSRTSSVQCNAHVKACKFTVPYFQLIQILKQPSRAVCHGQGPAELAARRIAHFRLYFRLSHAADERLIFRSCSGEKSCAINSVRCPAECGSFAYSRPQGRTFPNMAATSSPQSLQKFPEEARTVVPKIWSEDLREVAEKV